MDFESEGLLDGLTGEEERRARVALLEKLLEAGFAPDEIKEAADAGRLALLPVERVLGGEQRYTSTEAAERSGVDEEFLRALWRALGLSEPEAGQAVLTDVDVEAARRVLTYREAGLPDEDLLEVARMIGQGMAKVADAVRSMVGQALIKPGDNELDLGLRYARAAEEMVPLLGPILEHALTVHLRELIRSDVVDQAQLASGRLPGAREVTVCFADLVGFTALGEEVPADALGEVAGRLGELAAEVARPPVRLVKTIGDAAMLVSPDTDPLLDAVFELREAAAAEGESYPRIRTGLAHGEALQRSGDWYGRPVNLASRLSSLARPGSVLATAEVREAAGAAWRWSATRELRIKGVQGGLRVFRVRPGEGA